MASLPPAEAVKHAALQQAATARLPAAAQPLPPSNQLAQQLDSQAMGEPTVAVLKSRPVQACQLQRALAARLPRPPGAAAAEPQIQPWATVVGVRCSLLRAERRLQPWCPGGACAPAWLTPGVGKVAFLQE